MKEYTIDNVISNLDLMKENISNEQRELIIIAQNLIEQNFKTNVLVKDVLK